MPEKTVKRRLQDAGDAALASDDGPIFSTVAAEHMASRIPGARPAEFVVGASHFLQEDAGPEKEKRRRDHPPILAADDAVHRHVGIGALETARIVLHDRPEVRSFA